MTEENLYQAPASELHAGSEGELIYAGFWIRFAASIIDSILMIVIIYPLLTAIYGLEYWVSTAFIQGTWDVLLSYVFPAIAVVLFWTYRSATPGKMMLGLRIVSLGESRKPSTGQLIIRYLGYYPSMIVLFIGFIWAAFDKRKQAWHDKMANTAVIKNS